MLAWLRFVEGGNRTVPGEKPRVWLRLTEIQHMYNDCKGGRRHSCPLRHLGPQGLEQVVFQLVSPLGYHLRSKCLTAMNNSWPKSPFVRSRWECWVVFPSLNILNSNLPSWLIRSFSLNCTQNCSVNFFAACSRRSLAGFQSRPIQKMGSAISTLQLTSLRRVTCQWKLLSNAKGLIDFKILLKIRPGSFEKSSIRWNKSDHKRAV